MIYNMKQNNFNALGGINLKLDDIKSVIEFGQLGKGKIVLHSSSKDDTTDRLSKVLNASILDDSVPPTSVQSFLEARPSLTTVVITNHGKKLKNRYYNNILDDGENLDFNRYTICLFIIEIFVYHVLEMIVTGESAPQSADLPIPLEDLVTEMLYCYIQSAKCTRFHAASTSGAKLINQILPLYVGVHRALNAATTLTGQLLALLTGEKLSDMNETTCHKNRLTWMGGYNFTEICINSTVNYSTAVSPAFIINSKAGDNARR
ncbi:Nicastrin [Ooceraea biroi]|uniref:Nicastrin n=1 Tax=Ooceraea biroi TaxID=2015173 RepID=A0A026WUE8_OOCBI|nr:Nicastrin [Ooceraea biroi]